MKKAFLFLSVLILITSCSRTGFGAYYGSLYGSWIGGNVGGIVGGHRGHHIGTVVGLITGAATGAAVAANEERREHEYLEGQASRRHYDRRYEENRHDSSSHSGRKGSKVNRHNDEMPQVVLNPASCPLTLRNLRFVDEGGNQTVNREENAKIIFELANNTSETINDVVPYVYEVSGNTHIFLSPTARIESIKPGDVMRYTCALRSDNKLSPGVLKFRIAVSCSESDFVTLREFELPSAK